MFSSAPHNSFKAARTKLSPNHERTTMKRAQTHTYTQESRDLSLPCGIRSPTYTTAGGAGAGGGGSGEGALLDPGCGHTSTIVSIVPIPAVAEGRGVDSVGGGGGRGGGGPAGGLPLEEANFFQVASLDDRGAVSIWLASEAPRGDDGGSQVWSK